MRVSRTPQRRPTEAASNGSHPVRQQQHRLDDVARRELIDAYQAGERRIDLATRFDVHPATVDPILARARVPARPPKRMTDAEITQSADLYQSQRMSCAQIGHRLGYDAKTIWKVLRTSGILLRSTNGSEPGTRGPVNIEPTTPAV